MEGESAADAGGAYVVTRNEIKKIRNEKASIEKTGHARYPVKSHEACWNYTGQQRQKQSGSKVLVENNFTLLI